MVIIAHPIAILIGLVSCLFNDTCGCSSILAMPSITKKIATVNARMSIVIGSR